MTSTRKQVEPIAHLVSEQFVERVVKGYNAGMGGELLPADEPMAKSFMPPATASYRDFSYISADIPRFASDACPGCMECVSECPDTAILAKVVPQSVLEERLAKVQDPEGREHLRSQFVKTLKYYTQMERKGEEPGYFGLFIDPTKCKGCAECVEVCGSHQALEMVQKTPESLSRYRQEFAFFKGLPETPLKYINEKAPVDMMLAEKGLLYVGGAGSCMGCGEGTAIRMLLAATGFVYGEEGVGVAAATGCNTVFGSTYPYNPFRVSWSNSLFENVATFAMGIRAAWNQRGWQQKRLWCLGGDGAMFDIGFQALSRMLMSRMDIKVMVLDTQVYSNTGGQASTASFLGQDAKMSAWGSAIHGKREKRKELGLICMMHPDVFVAQTTPANFNHFYRAVMAANQFPGPAVVVVYAACQPEHGIGDAMAFNQARLAVDSRAFPLFIYDPRRGDTIGKRLDLQGNPAKDQDWYHNPKTGDEINFVSFAKAQGRFSKQFDKEGRPSEELGLAQQERLEFWHTLQELAGLYKGTEALTR